MKEWPWKAFQTTSLNGSWKCNDNELRNRKAIICYYFMYKCLITCILKMTNAINFLQPFSLPVTLLTKPAMTPTHFLNQFSSSILSHYFIQHQILIHSCDSNGYWVKVPWLSVFLQKSVINPGSLGMVFSSTTRSCLVQCIMQLGKQQLHELKYW